MAYTSIITLPPSVAPGTYSLTITGANGQFVQTAPVTLAGGTVPTGSTGGVPNWLYKVGFAGILDGNQASLYIRSALKPRVRIIRPGSSSFGDGWQTDTDYLATVNALREYNYVFRVNGAGSSIGLTDGETYYFTISNPATPAETINLQLTVHNQTVAAVNELPLVPATIPTPVPTGGGGGGSTSDLDAYLGADLVYTGEVVPGFTTNPSQIILGVNLVGGKVYPTNTVSFSLPSGYFVLYQIDGEFYPALLGAAGTVRANSTASDDPTQLSDYPGGVQGVPILVTRFVVANGTPRSGWSSQGNHNQNYLPVQASITVF